MKNKFNKKALKSVSILLYVIMFIGTAILIWSATEFFIEIKKYHDLQESWTQNWSNGLNPHTQYPDDVWLRWINFGENGYSPFKIMFGTIIALPIYAVLATWAIHKLADGHSKTSIIILSGVALAELSVIVAWVVMALV